MSNCCLPRAEKLSEVDIVLPYKLANLEEGERKPVIVHRSAKQQSQGTGARWGPQGRRLTAAAVYE